VVRGRASEVLRPIPEEDQPYAPCFDVRVTDPAGHTLAQPTLCLSVMDVKQTIRALDRHPGGAGCALSRLGQTDGGWLAALALVGLLRRRLLRRV
jgi:hypothetical protein